MSGNRYRLTIRGPNGGFDGSLISAHWTIIGDSDSDLEAMECLAKKLGEEIRCRRAMKAKAAA